MVVHENRVSQLVVQGDKVKMRCNSWEEKVITPLFFHITTHCLVYANLVVFSCTNLPYCS
jgi:hypothetical protein